MGYRSALRRLISTGALFGCGVIADEAWRNGYWGVLVGAIVGAAWLCVLTWLRIERRSPRPTAQGEMTRNEFPYGLVLDAAPTPILMIDGGHARALNRAARRVFATDDRITPLPPGLIANTDDHLSHDGRQWRVDRVILGAAPEARTLVTLIDVEQAENLAEARATTEMIHVIGHEVLNGLAPIVSLAESGEAALDQAEPDPVLLREILGTLARRAEGLHRFAEAYRELARFPAPRMTPVSSGAIAGDLAHLFAGRWPDVELVTNVEMASDWVVDRDQFHQALWAILQNAAEASLSVAGKQAQVTLILRSTDGERIVEVTDNGRGVASDAAIRIFRPFHTTKPDGTGIGLSLARQIALAHGGSLSLLPVLPTTFRLVIPRES